MNVRSVSASGAVVLWSMSTDFDAQPLTRGLSVLGMSKHAPRTRTPHSALEAALQDAIDPVPCSIFPLDPRANGFDVLRVNRGANTVEARPLLKANVDVSTLDITIEMRGEWDGSVSDLADQVQQHFDTYSRQITGIAVGKALTSVLDELGAVRLRDAGGAYWLPEDMLATWEAIETVVTEAAVDRQRVKFDLLRTIADERGLRAIKHSLEDEVSREATRLLTEITTGGLGERALETRKQQAIELRGKVGRYESILGEALATLRAACDECENAAVLGSMQLMSE